MEWREVLRFSVPGLPIAQPRVKASTRGGHVAIYTPTTIKNANTGESKPHPIVEFKSLVKLMARTAYAGPLLTGPVRVDATFWFPRASAQIWKKKSMPAALHVKKPDRDNLDKSLLDSLKSIVWVDDCQVCSGSIEKWTVAGGEPPRVDVIVFVPLEAA